MSHHLKDFWTNGPIGFVVSVGVVSMPGTMGVLGYELGGAGAAVAMFLVGTLAAFGAVRMVTDAEQKHIRRKQQGEK